MRTRTTLASLLLAANTFALAPALTEPPLDGDPPAPVVVAVMGEPGVNPFHTDLATDEPVPAGLPDAVTIPLDDLSGSFAERMASPAADQLRDLEEGTLYRLGGTRILGVYRSGDGDSYDILSDREHGTGVISSVVGAEYGTAPDAWVVYVADTSAAAWQWVADQPWIDLVTVSTWEAVSGGSFSGSVEILAQFTCAEGPAVADMIDGGKMVFSLAGNHDQGSLYSTPPGLPDVYQVGGVDEEGRPVLPPGDGHIEPQPGQDPVEYVVLNAPLATHPYETGDRYDYDAADPDGLTGPDQFGGTSGATPSTTGRAAAVVAEARRVVGHRTATPGPHDGALARGPGTGGGPLDDGVLTRSELADLLHAVARPSAPAVPGRYLYEGFGALDDETTEHAIDVLHGRAPVPTVSPDDQAHHDLVEQYRAITTAPPRCGPGQP